jgi:hypothetical protein
VPNWRDELIEAVKTRQEREDEEAARHRQRVVEALSSAESALELAREALGFAKDRIAEKGQAAVLEPTELGVRLTLGALALGIELDRATAVLRVSYLEGRPREFDFARDRHIAPTDVEEYVGRRAVELVRNVQKAAPW